MPEPVSTGGEAGVDALAVIQQYSQELAQERHDRIVAQCTQRQLEDEVARLTALLETRPSGHPGTG